VSLLIYCYTECHYAECYHAERHFTECHIVLMVVLNVISLSVILPSVAVPVLKGASPESVAVSEDHLKIINKILFRLSSK
jgi:hypothetical protein